MSGSIIPPWLGLLASFEKVHVVGEDLGVIERQWRRRLARIEKRDRFCIVGGARFSAGARDIHNSYRLSARIAIGARIDAEQRANFYLKRDLLACLTHCRLFDGLTEIDEAARNRPSVRKIFALDKNDL